MLEQDLRYQLKEPKQEDFIVIPSLNIAIAKSKARKKDGEVLTGISCYEIIMLIQSLGSQYFLPTSYQWSKSREFLKEKYPELEKDFISDKLEYVGSILAFPKENGEYSPTLQIPEIKKGKAPLLIEQLKVEKEGDKYILKEGKVTEVPGLPLKSGYIQGWDDDLGLPTKVGEKPNSKFEGGYFDVNKDYNYHEGLRVVVRGLWPWYDPRRRFDILVKWHPSQLSSIGFRLGTTPDGFLRMPRTEYETLPKLIKEMYELSPRI